MPDSNLIRVRPCVRLSSREETRLNDANLTPVYVLPRLIVTNYLHDLNKSAEYEVGDIEFARHPSRAFSLPDPLPGQLLVRSCRWGLRFEALAG
jgi:hypothetical protein